MCIEKHTTLRKSPLTNVMFVNRLYFVTIFIFFTAWFVTSIFLIQDIGSSIVLYTLYIYFYNFNCTKTVLTTYLRRRLVIWFEFLKKKPHFQNKIKLNLKSMKSTFWKPKLTYTSTSYILKCEKNENIVLFYFLHNHCYTIHTSYTLFSVLKCLAYEISMEKNLWVSVIKYKCLSL